jgi:hypothetical protein
MRACTIQWGIDSIFRPVDLSHAWRVADATAVAYSRDSPALRSGLRQSRAQRAPRQQAALRYVGDLSSCKLQVTLRLCRHAYTLTARVCRVKFSHSMTNPHSTRETSRLVPFLATKPFGDSVTVVLSDGGILPDTYVVKAGDTLSGIAQTNGYKSWRDVYFHPDNQPFRTKRPNPNLIFPGRYSHPSPYGSIRSAGAASGMDLQSD